MGLSTTRKLLGRLTLQNNSETLSVLDTLFKRKLEARLGLQKIIFGPTQILRPLSWFDSFDIKTLRMKHGVEALRLKWFSSNNNTFWSWLIKDDLDTISYGGRYEFLSP